MLDWKAPGTKTVTGEGGFSEESIITHVKTAKILKPAKFV